MFLESKYLLLVSSQLSQFKKKSNNLFNFRCPYCGDSQKSTTKARGYVFSKKNNLFFKCHNCGVGKSVPNLIKDVDEKIYNEFIVEKYRPHTIEERLKITAKKVLKSFKNAGTKGLIKVSSLSHDHPVKKFVESRQIPSRQHYKLYYVSKFYKWINTTFGDKFPSLQGDHPRLVIPFFNQDNIIIAVQGRAFGNENPKYITIKTRQDESKIFGLDKVDWNKVVYVVEGPIDSLFLDNCIATAQSDLRIPKKEKVVLVPDNEPRNKEVLGLIEKYIDQDYQVVIWPDDLKEKDINEMILSGKTERQIKDMIAQNTYSGVHARLKFIAWKRRELNAH